MSAGERCLAAHVEDASGCEGPLDAVRVVDQHDEGATGCVRHGAVLLASLERGRVYPGPGGEGGEAIEVFKRAQTLSPFSFEGADEELSTPVPVSEGSQVSGEEVGPASGVVAGSNQIAATGAGNGPGGVVPVPVAAQPECVAGRRADGEPLPPTCCGGWIGEHGEGPILCDPCPPVSVATQEEISDDEIKCPHLADILAGRAKGCHDDSTCGWCAVIRSGTASVPVPVAAMRPLATVRCPECGNGVTAVVEALAVGKAWPKHYRKDAALGCSHWGMFHLIRPEHIEVPVPVAAQPEPDDKQFVLFDHHLDMDVWYRDDAVATEARASSGSHDDERWFKVGDYDGDPLCWENVLRANPDVVPVLLVRGPLVDHNPETRRTQREMDADLYENWVANQEAGTGSADPDGGQR